jgi:hypothetical protein
LSACQGLDFPLLENKNEYVVHGYAYSNYLKELNPPGQIFSKGASLDKAFEGEQIDHWVNAQCLVQQTLVVVMAEVVHRVVMLFAHRWLVSFY